MKKQILGLFAVIVLSATAISASNAHVVYSTVQTNSVINDTTPQKMMHHDKKMNKKNMDSSMNHSMDTMGRANSNDSTRF